MHRPLCSDRLSVKYRSSIGQVSVKCRPSIGQASVKYRSTICRLSVDYRPTVGRLSTDYRTIAGRHSTDGPPIYRSTDVLLMYCRPMHRPICSDRLPVKYRSGIGQVSVEYRSSIGSIFLLKKYTKLHQYCTKVIGTVYSFGRSGGTPVNFR